MTALHDINYNAVMKFKIFLLIFALNLVITVSAQTSVDENIAYFKTKLFDAGAAEYKLTADRNGRSISFQNNSQVNIKEFQLGCVKRKDNFIVILSEHEINKSGLKAATEDGAESYFWIGNHRIFPLEVCRKGKLAVINVWLENSSKWQLK